MGDLHLFGGRKRTHVYDAERSPGYFVNTPPLREGPRARNLRFVNPTTRSPDQICLQTNRTVHGGEVLGVAYNSRRLNAIIAKEQAAASAAAAAPKPPIYDRMAQVRRVKVWKRRKRMDNNERRYKFLQ